MLEKFTTSLSNWLRTPKAQGALFVTAFCLLVAVLNFPANHWLIGWDNVMPELNFELNFKRAFSSTWITNQGLGHVGGHGHAANLPHTITLWLMSALIPTADLRAVFTLLMYLSGSVGAYYLSHYLLKDKKGAVLASIAASLFYATNLGTIQQFFTPLESFVIFHGLLPWILLQVFCFLDAPRTQTRTLLFLTISHFFFSAIGFLPPLFVVYGLILAIISLSYLATGYSQQKLVRVVQLAGIVLVTNLYWLSSVAYFTATSANNYLYSLNNQLSTDGYNWQSIAYGGFADVALIKGFLYWVIDGNTPHNTPTYLLQNWHDFHETLPLQALGYAFFFAACIGVFRVFRTAKQNYKSLSLALVFIVLFVALAQRIPGISVISAALKELPIVNQAFRASFTKVSVPYALSMSVLLGVAVSWLTAKLSTLPNIPNTFKNNIPAVTLLVLLSFYGLPLFSGSLFSSYMQPALPDSYSQLTTFFAKQPAHERIAVFPLTDHWGWHYYDWGYIGSGFYWYGIEQPLLDRSFDSWSVYNETWYTQAAHAVDNKDADALLAVLDRYNTSWILIDPHIVPQNKEYEAEQIEFILSALTESGKYKLEKLNEFTLLHSTKPRQEIYSPNAAATAHGETLHTFTDGIYTQLGDYVSLDSDSAEYYPFSQLATHRAIAAKKQDSGLELFGKMQLGEEDTPAILRIPEVTEPIPASVSFSLEEQGIALSVRTQKPLIKLDDTVIDTNTEKSAVLPITGSSAADTYFLTADQSIYIIETNSFTKTSFPITISPSDGLPTTLFSTDVSQEYPITPTLAQAQYNDCKGRPVSGAPLATTAGLTLTAQQQSCISAPIGALSITPDNLFSLQFSYQLAEGTVEKFCITRQEDENKVCYNDTTTRELGATGQIETYQTFFTLENSGTYWLDIQLGQGTEFSVSDLFLTEQEKIVTAEINRDFWQEFFAPISLNLTHIPQRISLFIPDTELTKPYNLQGFAQQQVNCDALKRGSTSVRQQDTRVVFSASNGGIVCFDTLLATRTSEDNLLFISGSNLSGKPLELSIFNQTLGKVETTVSPKDSTFSIALALPHTTEKTSYSHILNTSSTSYKQTHTESALSELAVYTAPLQTFSQLSLTIPNRAPTLGQVPIQYIKNYTDYFSVVTVKADQAGVLVLDESFGDGWIALSRTDGLRRLDRVKFNNWATAWIVPAGTTTVTILYWPQLLSIVGYLACAGTMVFLGLRSFAKRESDITTKTHYVPFTKLKNNLLGRQN